MFCSVIIPTIGRNSLSRAVRSILDQNILAGEIEVIIVNDSGDINAVAGWTESDDVRIIHTNRRERSVARNTGAAVAKGRYLWFLDDDDWILPGAINKFQTLASRSPEAYWLFGGVHIVDEDGIVLAERNSGLNGHVFCPDNWWRLGTYSIFRDQDRRFLQSRGVQSTDNWHRGPRSLP
jgi:glycosyltransferase involved in cell wall biosynthesis